MTYKHLLVSLTAFFLGTAFMSTQALAAAPVTYSPNHYQCVGNKITVVLTKLPGISTSELLTLKIGTKTYTAATPNIRTESTVIGDLREITIGGTPDVNIIDASVIIPTINFGTNALGNTLNSAKFMSQLVITTIATPFIVGPYLGVVNDSKYYNLSCTATFIPYP